MMFLYLNVFLLKLGVLSFYAIVGEKVMGEKEKDPHCESFLVELRRVELLTSCMPCRRSTN